MDLQRFGVCRNLSALRIAKLPNGRDVSFRHEKAASRRPVLADLALLGVAAS